MSDNISKMDSAATSAQEALTKATDVLAASVSSQRSFREEQAEITSPNILRLIPRTPLEDRRTTRTQSKTADPSASEDDEAEIAVQAVVDASAADDSGGGGSDEQQPEEFPQIDPAQLALLRDKIKPNSTRDDIIREVGNLFPIKDDDLANNPTEADRTLNALDYLLNTSKDPKDKIVIEGIKEEFIAHNQEAIKLGMKTAEEAANTGENPSLMRAFYRDVTHDNKRELKSFFIELITKYPKENLKKICGFILHTAGAEIKTGGVGIEPGRITNIIREIRLIQVLIALTRYFESNLPRLTKELDKAGIFISPSLTALELAQFFLDIATTPYPDPQVPMRIANLLIESRGKNKEESKKEEEPTEEPKGVNDNDDSSLSSFSSEEIF